MGSTEFAANLFRATQAADKLQRDSIRGKDAANRTHVEVGRKVRQTIVDIGGVMPEKLPDAENIKKVGRRLQTATKNSTNSNSDGTKGGKRQWPVGSYMYVVPIQCRRPDQQPGIAEPGRRAEQRVKAQGDRGRRTEHERVPPAQLRLDPIGP
jgi:hypothetical protein